MDEEFGSDGGGQRPSRHQRGEMRDSMLLQATMRVADDLPTATLRVRNLSAGGLMAETPAAVVQGQPVDVELRNIGWVSGHVAWTADGRIGISFNQRIDPQMARKPVGKGGATQSMLIKPPAEKTRRPGLRIE